MNYINQHQAVVVISLGIILIFLGFNEIFPSVGFSVLSECILSSYLMYILVKKPVLFVVLMGFLFIRVTELLSGILIESGGYLTETDILGSMNGAFIRLPFYYIIFFFAVSLGYKPAKLSENSSKALGGLFIVFFVFFALLVIGMGLFAGLKYGFSFSMGINRFSFREFGLSPSLELFLNNRFLVVILSSMLYTFSENIKLKFFGFSCVVLTIFISVLHGEQFTAMVTLFLAFFIAPLINKVIHGENIHEKIIKIGLGAFFLGVGVVLLVYAQQGYDLKELAERRLLLQGQLWYIVDESSPNLLFGDFISFIRNIPSVLLLNTNEFRTPMIPYGMRELMYIYAIPDIYDIYLENNVTFTMGQMAMLLHWFGYVGMVPVVVLTGYLFGIAITYFVNSITRKDILSILLSSKILLWFIFGFQQGEYWYIFGLKTILFCVFVYLFETYRSSFNVFLLARIR